MITKELYSACTYLYKYGVENTDIVGEFVFPSQNQWFSSSKFKWRLLDVWRGDSDSDYWSYGERIKNTNSIQLYSRATCPDNSASYACNTAVSVYAKNKIDFTKYKKNTCNIRYCI